MAKPDGGTAFPRPYIPTPSGDVSYRDGMTLRDYFAGQALIALVGGGIPIEPWAVTAYRIADAMLAEREK